MRSFFQVLPLALLATGPSIVSTVSASPINSQYPLILPVADPENGAFSISNDKDSHKKLHGRFLWITDIHPDPYYKVYSATDEEGQCHRGNGPAGYYGAETASCDTPLTLVNATFKWIQENVADKVDFVIWTGDSARHDNDVNMPRSKDQVTSLNREIAGKMVASFGRNDDGKSPKVVPTFGNNDILPHNIMMVGPNEWTREYLDIWEPFIPEEQRHTFSMGGFYYVEVIPNRLAVFSLNTLYFFAKNAGVDGCIDPDEPGAHQFKWLRVQLQRMRQRGMKVILMGHVAPARTEGKQMWDETCWQMYTLFSHQFRDVIVGSLYGHMDWDHFMFNDFNDFEYLEAQDLEVERECLEDDNGEVSPMGVRSYMQELGEAWAELPKVPKIGASDFEEETDEAKSEVARALKKKKGKKGKKGKKDRKLGGKWAESYSLSLVSPSIIPAYYPTLRIIEYNTTDIEKHAVAPLSAFSPRIRGQESANSDEEQFERQIELLKKKKGKKEPKKPKIIIPKGPSKSAPPGPAYSPQTFSFTRYTQYFANLTVINNDFTGNDTDEDTSVQGGWDDGRHGGHKTPKKQKPRPKEFGFEVEYDTKTDKVYKLKDLTVRSYLDLARRMGKGAVNTARFDAEKKKKKKKDRKARQHNDLWLTFLRRVFVGSLRDDELIDRFVPGMRAGVSQEATAEGADRTSYEL